MSLSMKNWDIVVFTIGGLFLIEDENNQYFRSQHIEKAFLCESNWDHPEKYQL